MIAIVDYGVGNLFSLVSSFKYIGADVIVTSNPEEIRNSDKIILPKFQIVPNNAKSYQEIM